MRPIQFFYALLYLGSAPWVVTHSEANDVITIYESMLFMNDSSSYNQTCMEPKNTELTTFTTFRTPKDIYSTR